MGTTVQPWKYPGVWRHIHVRIMSKELLLRKARRYRDF
jgi:hypothetical protein